MTIRRTCSVAVALATALTAVVTPGAATAATSPSIQLSRTIRTTPFANSSSVSMRDAEGSAYVARDDSLWLADDNGRSIYEVNPRTGDLKRVIKGSAFETAPRFGGGSAAGKNRSGDLESMAYDQANDVVYAFSGSCCSSSALPAVFRLVRDSAGLFQVESYQALSSGSDYTASAWSPLDHKLYVGAGSDLRPYDYVSNTSGSAFRVSGVSGILGMSFSAGGGDLWVTTKSVAVARVDWASKKAVSGWSFSLSSYGMKDTRAVESVGGQLFVLDGYDGRSSGDPLRYAVFVYDVGGLAPPTPRPTASFTADPPSGPAPLRVTFTDTTTGGATSWSWTFGDGGTSNEPSPTHAYAAAGTYTATLTASNAGGSSSATREITVTSAPVGPVASFRASQDGTPGTPLLTVSFTDTSTGRPTDWSWDFGDRLGTSTVQNPSHTYLLAGTYDVTLRVSNANGSDTATTSIVVASDPDPQPTGTNLVGNPGFESGPSGWSTSETAVSINRVSGGHSGGWAAALVNSRSGTTCKLNDHPNWIASTTAGTYTGSFWVRANTAGATIKVRFVEYKAGTNVGERAVTASLSTSWQRVTVTYAPIAPGASTLDFQAYVSSAPTGTCFYADDASITVS